MKKKKNHIFVCMALIIAGYSYSLFAAEPILENTEWSNIYITAAQDRNSPRFLLAGDSISSGYYNGVSENFAKEANCVKYATSKFVGNPDFLEELSILLKRFKFSVIHINNGLHGWGYTEKQYEESLPELLKLLKTHANGAKLIWCMTTPVRKRSDLSRFNEQKNNRVIERNRIAAEFMTRNGIVINDLYGLVRDHPEYYADDGTHFNNEGKSAQAEEVAKVIKEQFSNKTNAGDGK